MSETTTRPRSNAVTNRWHVAMKTAFGEGVDGADAAVPPPGMSRDRLATLRKTFDTVRGQSPEVAMRPLQDVFNENLGDLLKDLRHYAGEPFPGLGFYRSAKYIERLCDAAAIISPKLPDTAKGKFDALKFGGKTPAEVQAAVARLVDIRGEKTGYPPGTVTDPEAEKQAYAVSQMTGVFLQVITLPDLAKVATEFGQKVNAVVREVITKDMRADGAKSYFPADGKG